MGRYGDALVTGPDLVQAAAHAAERALVPLGGRVPDLAVVFVSGDGPVEDALLRAAEVTGAAAVLGCSAGGVLAGAQGLEGTSAVSVLTALLPGAAVRTFHLEVLPASDGAAVVGMPEVVPGTDEAAVLLADPWSFPVEGFVRRAAGALPGLTFTGGMAHGNGPGTSRLLVDHRVVDRGAVGLLVAGASARPLVAQGCRPIGPAMTVTAAAGNVIHALAGVPALDKVRQVLADLPPPEQALASQGLHLGLAADEYADDHDYLVRGLLGSEGSGLLVGDLIEVGQTVRLQVRDAEAADRDLRAVLGRDPGTPGAGALLFTCNGRGAHLFGPSYGGASHDPAVVREVLAADAVAGFFAGGEIGPVAGRSHLHGFTASLLVLP